jgi:hypothetical protein
LRIRTIVACLVAGLLLFAITAGSVAFGRVHATHHAAPRPASKPAYQQVAYSAMALLTVFDQQGASVADMNFESVRHIKKGYRIGWIVTESDGTESRWVINTDLHGRITAMTLLHRGQADAR